MPSLEDRRSRPIVLSSGAQSATYGLFALAMALTLIGTYVGILWAQTILTSGVHVILAIAELAIIFTANRWSGKSPLNIVLFALFPLLSGITITPYLLAIVAGYVNGPAILFNAVLTTVFISLAAAVLARMAPSLAGWSRALVLALIGLLVLSVAQIFVPALRTQTVELFLAGAGIVLFGVFTAYDLQRIAAQGRAGANPFLLAIGLYLDIFNLFLMVLRFMTALSGERR